MSVKTLKGLILKTFAISSRCESVWDTPRDTEAKIMGNIIKRPVKTGTFDGLSHIRARRITDITGVDFTMLIPGCIRRLTVEFMPATNPSPAPAKAESMRAMAPLSKDPPVILKNESFITMFCISANV